MVFSFRVCWFREKALPPQSWTNASEGITRILIHLNTTLLNNAKWRNELAYRMPQTRSPTAANCSVHSKIILSHEKNHFFVCFVSCSTFPFLFWLSLARQRLLLPSASSPVSPPTLATFSTLSLNSHFSFSVAGTATAVAADRRAKDHFKPPILSKLLFQPFVSSQASKNPEQPIAI